MGRRWVTAAISRERSDSLLPGPEVVSCFDEHDVVLLQHREHLVLELPLPQLALVELRLHRLAALEVGEASHEEEDVRIFDRWERAPYLHPDLPVDRQAPGPEYLEEFLAHSGPGLVRPHLDDHGRVLR